jgi:P2 family phage major capsid protein
MRTETRLLYNALLARQAQLNGIPDATEKFAVDPSVQQTLETKIQESSSFLKGINIIGVDELKDEKLGLGISGPVASRTNTAATDRAPRSLEALTANTYECKKTDFDTFIRYQTLDAWAKFPDFQTRVRDLIVQRQALDRIMIGFNGTSAAANTDLAANPMLQDVNIGWLKHIETDAPTRVMDHGDVAGKITIGLDGDYRNVDALVVDVVNTLLDPWHQNAPGLVVILGRKLMNDKLFPLVNETTDPTEIIAADIVRSQRRVGGLAGVTVPYFPENALLVTTLSNLSIYWQRSARRRTLVDNAKRDRIENYESSNDAYVVEDYGLTAVAKNIEFLEG